MCRAGLSTKVDMGSFPDSLLHEIGYDNLRPPGFGFAMRVPARLLDVQGNSVKLQAILYPSEGSKRRVLIPLEWRNGWLVAPYHAWELLRTIASNYAVLTLRVWDITRIERTGDISWIACTDRMYASALQNPMTLEEDSYGVRWAI